MDSAAVVTDMSSMKSSLRSLVEGKEQFVKFDYKIILTGIMSVLGQQSLPVFTEMNCGDEGVKVNISLDLHFGNERKIAVIEGKPFISKTNAEISAVLTAIRHLEENCRVKVYDFSSRVLMSFAGSAKYTHVKESLLSVQGLLAKFETLLNKLNDLAQDAETHSIDEMNMSNRHQSGSFFGSIRECKGLLLQDFSVQAANVRSKINSLEVQRMQYDSKLVEKRKAIGAKSNFKKVFVTSKLFLDYVLSYLGLNNAKYSNGPDGNGLVEAKVKFYIPYTKEHKYGGTLKINAKGKTSTNAEENAAFQALLFIEQNFRVTLVDLNYSDRVDAHNEEFMLTTMLGEILGLGENIKEMWENFDKAVSHKKDDFGSRFKECLQAITFIEENSANFLGASWKMLENLEDITSKMNSMKLKSEST